MIWRKTIMTKIKILALAAGITGLAVAAFPQDHNTPLSRGLQMKDADQALTKQYWTNDRLANTKPMPLPVVDPATVVPSVRALANPAATPATPRILNGTRPTITPAKNNESQWAYTRQDESLTTIKMLDHSGTRQHLPRSH
jgi:hypothetical protein